MIGFFVEWNGPPDFMEHNKCLREGYPSGKGMELCPGSHAERMAISNVAEYNKGTHNGTIYLSSWFPCADCAKMIIDAGIIKLVCEKPDLNNEVAEFWHFKEALKMLAEVNVEIEYL